MKNILFASAAILLLLPVLAFSHEEGSSIKHVFPDDDVQELNKNIGKKIEPPLRYLLKNERINLLVDDHGTDVPSSRTQGVQDGTVIASILIEKKGFKGASFEKLENPTANIYFTKETYAAAKEAGDDGGRVLIEALQKGDARKEIFGTSKKIKMTIFAYALKKYKYN